MAGGHAPAVDQKWWGRHEKATALPPPPLVAASSGPHSISAYHEIMSFMTSATDLARDRFDAVLGSRRGAPEQVQASETVPLDPAQERLLRYFADSSRHMVFGTAGEWSARSSLLPTSANVLSGPNRWVSLLRYDSIVIAAKTNGQIIHLSRAKASPGERRALAELTAFCVGKSVHASPAMDDLLAALAAEVNNAWTSPSLWR